MKNKKMMMLLAITLMTIGFASVSTVLYLNGQTFVASNTGDFDVYYSKAVENGVENNSLIKDKTHIEFTTELTGIDDKYVLDYDVTNASKQYDANLVMNCVGGNEYLRVSNRFDTTEILPARTTRSGRLTLTVIKVPLTEMSVSITCEISGRAVERDAAGGDAIEKEQVDGYLASAIPISLSQEEFNDLHNQFDIEKFGSLEKANEYFDKVCPAGGDSDSCDEAMDEYNKKFEEWVGPKKAYLWSGLGDFQTVPEKFSIEEKPTIQFLENLPGSITVTNLNIESITFTTTNEVPNNAIKSWDGSAQQNGSIMVWILDDENNDGGYELYIGQNGGVKANPNSSSLFYNFYYMKEIKGLENLDTSNVTNMNNMFYYCEYLTNLDLSSFKTSNVTDMSGMFNKCINLRNLILTSFDTSNVTDMNDMFYECNDLITTITMRGTNCTKYYAFTYSASSEGAQITINYTEDASDLVDQMIATVSSKSNVIKGSVVA